MGFPPVEPTDAPKVKNTAAKKQDEGKQESLWDNLVQNVLTNPFIWGMALTYFFIYIVRQASKENLPFLCEERGLMFSQTHMSLVPEAISFTAF